MFFRNVSKYLLVCHHISESSIIYSYDPESRNPYTMKELFNYFIVMLYI
jgi:hypothetical protein